MSYVNITAEEIAIGEPIKNSTLEKIRGNFTDLKNSISDINDALDLLSVQSPMYFNYSGYTDTITDEHFTALVANFTVNDVKLTVKDAGSSGTTQVDVLYKRGAGAWTSIFSTNPSLAFGAGSYATSSNAVLSTTVLLAGDLIRCRLVTSQVNAKDCVVLVIPGA